jgi:hypothetical protein
VDHVGEVNVAPQSLAAEPHNLSPQSKFEVDGWLEETKSLSSVRLLLQLIEQEHLIQHRLHAAARLADHVHKR